MLNNNKFLQIIKKNNLNAKLDSINKDLKDKIKYLLPLSHRQDLYLKMMNALIAINSLYKKENENIESPPQLPKEIQYMILEKFIKDHMITNKEIIFN